MLKEKGSDGGREQKPPTAEESGESQAEQRNNGRIGFQDPLDIPFAIQFLQSDVQHAPIRARHNKPHRLLSDA